MADIHVTTLNQALEVRDYNARMAAYEKEREQYIEACMARATDIVNEMLQTIANGTSERYVLVLHETIYRFGDWKLTMSNSSVRKPLDFPKIPFPPTKPNFDNNEGTLVMAQSNPDAWSYILDAMGNAGILFEKLPVSDSLVVFIDIPSETKTKA